MEEKHPIFGFYGDGTSADQSCSVNFQGNISKPKTFLRSNLLGTTIFYHLGVKKLLGEMYVFGGYTDNHQISILDGCQLRRLEMDLPIGMSDPLCTTYASGSAVMFCVGWTLFLIYLRDKMI